MIEQTIQDILTNFDFSYMITVNALTYFIINVIDYMNGDACVSFWLKRLILILAVIIVGGLYYVTNVLPINVLINSSIAAPVFWSWIAKPVLAKTGLDYKKIDECLK